MSFIIHFASLKSCFYTIKFNCMLDRGHLKFCSHKILHHTKWTFLVEIPIRGSSIELKSSANQDKHFIILFFSEICNNFLNQIKVLEENKFIYSSPAFISCSCIFNYMSHQFCNLL